MSTPHWIRASEIQSYTYCGRSWWLHYVLGLEPQDSGQMDAGTERHRAQGNQVLRSEGLGRIAAVLLALAIFFGAIALVWLLHGG